MKQQPDYANWDWSRRNIDLAREHGVNQSIVSAARRILKKPKVTKHFPACKSWDWTKSDTAIARENRVNLLVVSHYRKQLAMPSAPRDYEPPIQSSCYQPKRDYQTLDWNKTDPQLARETGLTRERIRQIRALLGKPKRYYAHGRLEDFKAMFSGVKAMDFQTCRSKLNIAQSTFKRYCLAAGITVLRTTNPQYPWDKMNFQLPNAVLSAIWKIPTSQCASRRSNHQLPKALFQSVKGHIPEQFQPLVNEEKAKAATLMTPAQPPIAAPGVPVAAF